MPYSAEHKARTRERIVTAARALFNRHGFEPVSIDQIMARAELTRGGFYNHFPSKAALYAEAVGSYVDCNPFALRLAQSRRPPPEAPKLARMLIERYLSDEVLEDGDAALPPLRVAVRRRPRRPRAAAGLHRGAPQHGRGPAAARCRTAAPTPIPASS